MNINDFYSLDSCLLPSAFQVTPIGLKQENESNILSDKIRLLTGDYSNFSFPIVFRQDYGRKLQDLLDTGIVSLFLISDKMKIILEENDLTGCKFFNVIVFDRRGNEVKGYHGLSVTGRCGLVDFRKAEIIERQYIPNGPIAHLYKGLYVGLDEWDGSDFFMPPEYYGIIITQKIADILKQNKLTNIRLTNLTDVEHYVDFAPKNQIY